LNIVQEVRVLWFYIAVSNCFKNMMLIRVVNCVNCWRYPRICSVLSYYNI